MIALADFLDRSKFTMELLVCCILFFWPLKKRSRAPWRLTLGFLGCVGVVLLQPLAELQFPLHNGHASLGKKPGDKLRCLPPSHAVDKVNGPLSRFVLEVPVNR